MGAMCSKPKGGVDTQKRPPAGKITSNKSQVNLNGSQSPKKSVSFADPI